MKKSLLLAGLLLTTTGAFAATEQFVGLDLLKGSVSTSNSATGTISRISTNQSLSGSYTEGNTLKDTSYQFKIGAVLDDSSRVYFSHLSLSDTLYDETYKYSLNAINYDYFIKNDQLNGFIPYVGGHIGYGKTTFSDMMPSVSSMDYGYNIGILKNIDKKLSFELAYKQTFVDSTSSLSGSLTAGDYNIAGTYNEKNEDVSSLSFGLNYKF